MTWEGSMLEYLDGIEMAVVAAEAYPHDERKHLLRALEHIRNARFCLDRLERFREYLASSARSSMTKSHDAAIHGLLPRQGEGG